MSMYNPPIGPSLQAIAITIMLMPLNIMLSEGLGMFAENACTARNSTEFFFPELHKLTIITPDFSVKCMLCSNTSSLGVN